jgi:triosephosphate isomerase (TIM)
MAKKIVAANWKMNLLRKEAISLINVFNERLKDNEGLEVIVFPPSIYIADLLQVTNTSVHVGAQNFYFEEKGAYTGEVSATQLKDLGCSYALVGHSERRMIFDESNEMIYQKIKAALQADINIVYCCGESFEERESGKHKIKIKEQIEVLKSLSSEELSSISIAYEPIWAIGTGLTATPFQAEEMHAFIRGVINELFSEVIAQDISILYGGSCNEKNAAELFNCPNIDGGLIGGASLKVDSFLKIVDSIK